MPGEDYADFTPSLGRAPARNVTLHPGGFVVIKLIRSYPDGASIILEPRVDTKTFQKYEWPAPALTKVIANEIHVPNNSKDIITVRKNEHVCQVRSTNECEVGNLNSASSDETPSKVPPVIINVPRLSLILMVS